VELLVKNKFKIIILLLVLILPTYFLMLSPKAREARLNVTNSKRIEVDMDIDQVVKIMGLPNERLSRKENQYELETFYYVSPAFASDGIFINFNKEGKVEKIVLYE